MKKAQISFIIILGIVIVIAFLLMPYSLSKLKVFGGSGSSPESYITSCITQNLGIGLQKLGAHGGYFTPSATAHIQGYNFTRLSAAPAVADIESQLDDYLDSNVPGCLNNINNLHGINITVAGGIRVNVSIHEDDIMAMVHMPVRITTHDSVRTVDDFNAKIDNIRLPAILSYMNETIRTIEEGLGTDARLVDRNGLDVYYIPTENGTVVDIIDPASLVDSEPFEISYVVQG